MEDRFAGIREFVLAVDKGSFTAAATQLGVPGSAVARAQFRATTLCSTDGAILGGALDGPRAHRPTAPPDRALDRAPGVGWRHADSV